MKAPRATVLLALLFLSCSRGEGGALPRGLAAPSASSSAAASLPAVPPEPPIAPPPVRASSPLVCPEAFADCNHDALDGCETALDTTTHCGACDAACPVLFGGTMTCVAAPVPAGRRCVADCGAGKSQCGTLCADTASDVNHCGACGRVCPGSATCTAGRCDAERIATNLGKPDYLRAAGQSLFVVDSAGRIMERDLAGAPVREWTDASPRGLVVLGDYVYWLAVVPRADALRAQHRFAGGATQTLTRMEYGRALDTDGASLFVMGARSMVRYVVDRAHASSLEFPNWAAAVTLGGLALVVRVQEGSESAFYEVDGTTLALRALNATWSDVSSDGCVIAGTLYFHSAHSILALPLSGGTAPSPLPQVAPTLDVTRLLCDGNGFYVGIASTGGSTIYRYELPSGPLVRVADGLGQRLGPLVRVGADLYWTLPDEGALVRVRL